MSISVYCDKCAGTFKVQDKRAGKQVYCKRCNEVVWVPKPSAVEQVADDSEDSIASADIIDAFSDMTPLPRTRVAPLERKRSRRRGSSAGMAWPLSRNVTAVLVGVLVLAGIAIIAAQMNPMAGGILVLMLFILGMLASLVGFVVMVVGGLGLIISAFEEDTACGLMYMFVPFYSLYYLVSRWDETRYPKFVAYGFLMALGPVFLLVGLEEITKSNRGGFAPAGGPHPLAGEQPGTLEKPMLDEEAFRISQPVGDATLQAGDRVLIRRGASWWRGQVLSIEPDGTIKVHYAGWADALDEVVSPDRVRIPNP